MLNILVVEKVLRSTCAVRRKKRQQQFNTLLLEKLALNNGIMGIWEFKR